MPRLRFTWIVRLLALSLLAGCSQDIHQFISTPDRPTTVALVDPLRDAVLWEMDVPVWHMLKLDFGNPPEMEPVWANMEPATRFTWKLYNVRTDRKIEQQKMQLTGTQFVMRVTYRPAPEFPPHEDSVLRAGEATPLPTTLPVAPSASAPAAASQPTSVETEAEHATAPAPPDTTSSLDAIGKTANDADLDAGVDSDADADDNATGDADDPVELE